MPQDDEPIYIQHQTDPMDRVMRLMEMRNGAGRTEKKSNPGQMVAGAAIALGGGCNLAGNIVQSVFVPTVNSQTSTYSQGDINAALNTLRQGARLNGILSAIGNGLILIGGGAEIVGGAARR